MNDIKITCIVPVFCEEKTIGRVLDVLTQNGSIDEVIVVDDCSTDNSRNIINGYADKITLIQNTKNIGKGGSVIKALSKSKYEHILMCDADLCKINQKHVNNIIHEYRTGKYAMVIAARENKSGPFGINKFFASLSGERVFKKEILVPYANLIEKNGYGLEKVINFAHRDQKVKVIISEDIGHLTKVQKGEFNKMILGYIKEFEEVIKTDLLLKKESILRDPQLDAIKGIFNHWYFEMDMDDLKKLISFKKLKRLLPRNGG